MDASLGPRIVNAKIWVGAATDEPSELTHKGHEIFDDPASFALSSSIFPHCYTIILDGRCSGTYDTILWLNPKTGDTPAGNPIQLLVNNPTTAQKEAKVTVNLMPDPSLSVSPALTTIASSLAIYQNTVALVLNLPFVLSYNFYSPFHRWTNDDNKESDFDDADKVQYRQGYLNIGWSYKPYACPFFPV